MEPLHPPEKRPGNPKPGLNPRRKTTVRPRRPRPVSNESGDSTMKWMIFFLIFGVGNVILYATTGYVIIPK